MKWQSNRQKSKTVGFAMAATTAIAAFGMMPAQAETPNVPEQGSVDNGVYVSLLSPYAGSSFAGTKSIEVSAFYQASGDAQGITSIALFIDGQKAAEKKLDSPEVKGVISFLIDPKTLLSGLHHIAVRAVAADSESGLAKTTLTYKADDAVAAPQDQPSLSVGGDQAGAPSVSIVGPLSGDKVSGTVQVQVNATDLSGKSPFVSLFVDNVFKTLRNYPPYTFDWDTTTMANGMHTIKASASNDTATSDTQPVKVWVNNVTGNTVIMGIPDAPITHPATVAESSADPIPVGDPVLAHGSVTGLSTPAARPEQLASANIGDARFSEETMLAAPFLREQPIPAPTVAVAGPSLAREEAPGTASQPMDAIKFAPAAFEIKLSPETLLDAPVVSPQSLLGRSDMTSPALAHVSSVAVASVADNSVTHLASVSFDAPKPEIGNLLTAPDVAPTASVSRIPMAPELAAPGAANETLPVDAQRIASISIDAPDPEVALPQAPLVPGEPTSRVAAPNATPRVAIRPQGRPLLAKATVAGSSLKGQGIQLASASVAGPGIDPTITLLSPFLHPVASPATPSVVTHESTVRVAAPIGGFFGRNIRERISGSYQVVMNDHAMTLERPIQDHKDVLCAPLRRIFESQGGMLEWDAKKHQVHAFSASKDFDLTIGSKKATVNNQPTMLSTAPYINAGRTMIPVGFLPLALNVVVAYDPMTGHLTITSKS